MKTFNEFITEINYKKIEKDAQKLAANAKDGILKYDGDTYTFKFDRPNSGYIVTKGNEEITRINSKKLPDAKKFFKKWMES